VIARRRCQSKPRAVQRSRSWGKAEAAMHRETSASTSSALSMCASRARDGKGRTESKMRSDQTQTTYISKLLRVDSS